LTVCEPGEALRLKSGGGPEDEATFSETLVFPLRLPLIPKMVIVESPSGVPAVVVIVSVDEPWPVMVDGEKLTVVPAGAPLALRVTVPLKPLWGVTVTV
jgi:hypothetical protein